ncbi:MAG: cell division protease FtsH, partial [Candidatus Paceibacteria bacterium]
TPGFSGADLYSLVNEAAISAAREERKEVGQIDLLRSIEKVMLGPERQSHLLSTKEKKITAYHEAGHALVASALPYADPVHKISIISRGRTGGYTLKLPDEDKKLHSKKEFIDDLAMTLGGYVTEELVFGDLTTGPSNDLQVATATARNMVTRYGMSDKIGPIALESDGGRTLFGQGVDDREYSEKVGNMIDEEIEKLIRNAYEQAKNIITRHRNVLDAIVTKLMEVETLERDEYEKILIANGIEVKPKKDIEHSKK